MKLAYMGEGNSRTFAARTFSAGSESGKISLSEHRMYSGGASKISLPGHNRGTIISNGAHAIRPLNALKLK